MHLQKANKQFINNNVSELKKNQSGVTYSKGSQAPLAEIRETCAQQVV